MGLYLNPGNRSFQFAVNSEIYVDKTGLIEFTNSVINTEKRFVCVSRPRRFGKSMAANMLTAYYGRGCDSAELFKNLEIGDSENFERNLNAYDTIYVDMQAFCGYSVSEALDKLQRGIISELRSAYADVVVSEDDDLPMVISSIGSAKNIGFVFVIDEWDSVFRENENDVDGQKEYIGFLRRLFKNSMTGRYIALAYITGILPIKKYGTESALNNFDEYTMLNPKPLECYMGFTEFEVQDLFSKYEMDFESAKQWYDGYILRETHIYSPKSVIDSLMRKEIGFFWSGTEAFSSLVRYIKCDFDGLREAIILMLSGEHITINIHSFENDMTSFKNKDDVLTLLVHLGYLGFDKMGRVFIPNEEIRFVFGNAVKEAKWTNVIRAIADSERLLSDTLSGNEDAVATAIDRAHSELTSVLKYNDENSLNCVITMAYYSACNYFTRIRELPLGSGFADMVYVPNKCEHNPAMLIELKWDKSAETALKQIKEKRYPDSLVDYCGDVVLVGINYDKTTKKHECRIERITK